MKRHSLGALLLGAVLTSSLPAASMQISIGIRETGGSGPAFADGGTANGIEHVNRDGQALAADGTWQLFTFTPATDALTAFAGTTANSILEAGMEWVTLEHIRVRNNEGITKPIRLWIDDITNTTAAGAAVEGFESHAVGTEVMFQEPNFSGSTAANLVAGGTALVSNTMAISGSHSNEVNFQFVDADPSRWVRLTTFGTATLQDPLFRVQEPGAPAPTISFYAKAMVVPEPTSLALAGFAVLGLGMLSRRY